MIKLQGPLRCYSARSMERVIGVYSNLIKSKRKGGRNASSLVERFAIHNYINTIVNVQNEINLIRPQAYGEESFMNLAGDHTGAQLWEPFDRTVDLNYDSLEGVSGNKIKEVLIKYYQRSSGLNVADVTDSTIIVAARLWRDSTVYSSIMYRRRKNETSRGNHYVMFTCPYRK